MHSQLLIILLVILSISINSARLQKELKERRGILETFKNVFKITSPNKKQINNFCIWNICSRPLNLKRIQKYKKIEEMVIKKKYDELQKIEADQKNKKIMTNRVQFLTERLNFFGL